MIPQTVAMTTVTILHDGQVLETEAQADFLTRVGCHQLQGFHLGRPMQVEQVAAEILSDFRSAVVSDTHERAPPRAAAQA